MEITQNKKTAAYVTIQFMDQTYKAPKHIRTEMAAIIAQWPIAPTPTLTKSGKGQGYGPAQKKPVQGKPKAATATK